VVVLVLGSTASLPACGSKKQYDDDDDSSGGSSGTLGAGSYCDAQHTCKATLTCTGGVCAPKSAGSGGTTSVAPGSLGSTCDAANACDASLRCYSGICIPDTSGAGGTTSAEQGALAGPCYPNDTCNSGLTCFSGYCLPSDFGSGGSSTGGTGGDNSSGSGGTTGGSAQGGSSGHGGTGGTTGGSGGTGGSTGGTGGSSGGTGGSSGGTGGSTGGTGGSSGGTGGGSGTGGGGTGGTASTLIVAQDGWVADGSNSVGIVGAWYTFYDKYSTIAALPGGLDFTGAGDQICVSGTISHSDDYGPTVALNLNQPDPAGDGLGYTPATHGVTGFSFDIDGSPMPSSIQVTFSTPDMTNYCRFFTPPSTSNSISISQAQLDCWNGSGTPGNTSTSYQAIQFQLPVNYFADGQSYHYCITNLRALTN
jgi:hypothetical protein